MAIRHFTIETTTASRTFQKYRKFKFWLSYDHNLAYGATGNRTLNFALQGRRVPVTTTAPNQTVLTTVAYFRATCQPSESVPGYPLISPAPSTLSLPTILPSLT